MSNTMLIAVVVGGLLGLVALGWLFQSTRRPPMPFVPRSSYDQGDEWLQGLERVAQKQAARNISGRYADYKTGQITDAFAKGVQEQPPKNP